jgi:membrane protease YdiL (CAAX protease family)
MVESPGAATGVDPGTASRREVWGFWASAGFGVLTFMGTIVVQVVMLAGFAAYEEFAGPGLGNFQAFADSLESNGLLVAVATIASAVVTTPLILFFAWLRRGLPVGAYLGWVRPDGWKAATWLGWTVGLLVATDLLSWLLGRPIVSDFQMDAYRSAGVLPLLWIAFVVAAPWSEELLFRGFLLEGFRRSRLGPAGAVLLTSLIWTVLHAQYGLYELSHIFLLGIILGAARLSTGSLKVPMALHAVVNLIATIETHLAVSAGIGP